MENKNFTDNPIFSVVIPAYNASGTIVRTLDSVVNQTVAGPIEIIVVNDYSKDDTVQVVSEYLAALNGAHASNRQGILLENKGNFGVAYTRNAGIKKARGTYICYLDGDDWWTPDKLEKQMKALEKARAEGWEPSLVCCARELMDGEGNSRGKVIPVPEKITYKMILKTNSINCSSVVLKSEIAKEFPFERDDIHEDYISWLKILKKYGPALGADEPLLKYTFAAGSKSYNKLKSLTWQYKCYRHVKINVFSSLYYTFCYGVNGLRKYK